jgi:hypothetical protein
MGRRDGVFEVLEAKAIMLTRAACCDQLAEMAAVESSLPEVRPPSIKALPNTPRLFQLNSSTHVLRPPRPRTIASRRPPGIAAA